MGECERVWVNVGRCWWEAVVVEGCGGECGRLSEGLGVCGAVWNGVGVCV